MDEVDLHSDEKSQMVFGIRLGKNLSVFLICLCLTTVFWLLNAFTKDYSTELNFPLRYENVPAEQVVVNELPRFLTVKVNGFGFKLLSFYLFGSLDSLSVDYSSGIKKFRQGGDLSIIPKLRLEKLANTEIPSDIKIENINIDSLRICTDYITEKIVNVRPNVNYTTSGQSYLKDSITVSPKQILLSGPTSLLNKLDFISTQLLTLEDLDKSVSKDVDLDFAMNFSSDTKHVRLMIHVDKATEKELVVPIDIISDSTENNIKLFPNAVKVGVKIGLSDFDKLEASQFSFVVETTDFDQSKKYLTVKNVKSPKGAEVLDYSPHRVEYILKN